MARNHTTPRYWKSRGGYFVTVNGTQVLLAKGPKNNPEVKALAREKFREVLAEMPREKKKKESRGVLLVTDVTRDYLLGCLTPATPRNSRVIATRYLDLFRASFGPRPVTTLSVSEVRSWIETFPRWKSTATKRLCAVTVLKAFNHVLGRDENPLRGLARGYDVPSRARDATHLITNEIHERLLLAASPTTKDVLHALNDTGARPGEILQCTAAMYDHRLHALLPRFLKVKHKQRTIYLTPSLEDRVRLLVEKHPTGPLFKNTRGNPLRPGKLNQWFFWVRKKLNIGPVTPYMYRHRFATDFLLKGGTMSVLCALLGTSMKMIVKYYSHVGEHPEALRAELGRIRDVTRK